MIPIKGSQSVKYLLLALIGSIFVGETLSHLFIAMLPPLSQWHEALLDAALLLTLIFPAIYFLVFHPLKIQLTKQKQVETTQQEALDRLQKIASRVPGLVFQFQMRPDGGFCFPFASEAIRDIYRVSPEDVREDASKVFAILHPDDYDGIVASIQASARDLTPWHHEYRVKFDDGTARWLFGNALPQREADGSVLWHGFITDVTERKRMTTALLESEARFRTMADNAPVLIWIARPDKLCSYFNKGWLEFTGRTMEQEIGNGWEENIHPEDFQRCLDTYVTSFDARQEFITEYRLRRFDGEYCWLLDHGVPLYDEQDTFLGYIGSCIDITERKAIEEKINNLAFYDPLTQLPNRVLLADRMHQTLAYCRRNQEIAAVCMLDLDGFKQINDTLGHASGDQLLCDVAQRLQECIRQEDTAARFGGDEFALLLGGFKKVSECEQTLARIVASLAAPYQIFGQMAHISASIGVTLFPEDSSDPDLLLRHADQVMYEVKQTSKNGYQLFNSVHEKRNQTTQDFLKKIGEALVKGQFELYYQPKVDCRQGKVMGAEALVRWNHPILGILAPSEFIPVIEHNDLIISLGEWTIREALRQLNEWREAGFSIQISVNISARQLHNQEFLQRLQELLAGHDSEIIERLEIEIVEKAALEDMNVGGEIIRKCRAMGVRIALDDFGTGFSSLVDLKHLAADALKIDLSFVSVMLANPGDMAIVEGVIGLAASFRLQVVAEGVEYVDQILMLMKLGCDVMQGYGLARPMPAERMSTWLAAFTPDPLWDYPPPHNRAGVLRVAAGGSQSLLLD